jgi:hypothetical protein
MPPRVKKPAVAVAAVAVAAVAVASVASVDVAIASASATIEPVVAIESVDVAIAPVAVDAAAIEPNITLTVANTKKRTRKPKAPVAAVTEPLVVEPVAELPVVELPVVEPVVELPVVEPVVELPVAELPVVEPVAELPVAATKKASKAKKTVTTEPAAPIKKRGRKPKGGKLIQNLSQANETVQVVPNIILHLKCGAADIAPGPLSALNDNFKPGDVVSFNTMDPKGSDLHDSYHSEMQMLTSTPPPATTTNMCNYNYLNDIGSDDDCDDAGDSSTKKIMKKLNHLKTSFHMSDLFQAVGAAPRRSCCFWDTCEFDTPPVYLPKCISNSGVYVVYACFCSPECALAYLMNDRLDTSVKFERCQMLNAMHGKTNVSIKPAPNPQYTLSKFYGNLTIQEYRKLFKSEQIVYVVNKPLTHILPEIYEENNDFMLNNKIIPTNNYKLKKKTSGVANVTAFG